jgi:putative membrane protein
MSMFLVHHGMFLGPLFLFGQFFWFVLLALLIAALVRLFSRRRAWYYNRPPFYNPTMGPGVPHPGAPVPPVQPSAMEILRQRYARGEIDAATFDQMRERLEASGKPDQQ